MTTSHQLPLVPPAGPTHKPATDTARLLVFNAGSWLMIADTPTQAAVGVDPRVNYVDVTFPANPNHIALDESSVLDTADEFSRAASLLDEQKDRMASAVHGVADMLRRTADTLERENNATAAHYADQAATHIDRLSETVRSRPLGEMVTGAEAFARRQPALFIAGAVAAGFVIGRLLARPSPQPGETGRGAGYRADGEAMAGYGAGSGVGGEHV